MYLNSIGKLNIHF